MDFDEDEVLREMERIDDWLGSHLSARGWAQQHTFYSKRSLLREPPPPGLHWSQRIPLPAITRLDRAVAFPDREATGGARQHCDPAKVALNTTLYQLLRPRLGRFGGGGVT